MNTYFVTNTEFKKSAKESAIPKVLVVNKTVYTGTPLTFSSIAALEANTTVSALSNFALIKEAAKGAFAAGVAIVLAKDLAPELGNEVRAAISLATTHDISPTEVETLEADGIFRIGVDSLAPAGEGTTYTDEDKCRFVEFDTTVVSDYASADQPKARARIGGFIAAQINIGFYNDSALPYNNIPLPESVTTVDKVSYQSQTSLLAKFYTNNKLCLYVVNGTPCIFAIPTGATAGTLWFDLTTRQIADYVANEVINMLREKYPRTKRNKEVLTSIKASMLGLLEGLEQRAIIENVADNDVDVHTQAVVGKLDELVIAYAIDVVTPLYTVRVNQSVTLGDNAVMVG